MAQYNKNLPINVSSKNTSEGDGKILSFYGMGTDDINNILNRLLLPGNGPFRKVNPAKNIDKAWAKGNILFIKVLNDKVDDFLNSGMKSVISALVSSGKYDNDVILHLQDEADFALKSAMSKEEMNKLYSDNAASVIDMWTQYLNNINDPEMRKVLELYSKIYGNTIYGHALSLKNVMSIKAVDPNATFVLGRTTWASYGRGVKANAKKFPLWRYTRKNDATQQQIIDAQEALGHGLEEFGELGVAVQNAIMIEAEKEANKGVNLIPVRYIGYDISDTYLYNPKEDDPLVAKPNMSSNVVYQINALAKEAEAKKNAESGNSEIGSEELSAMNKRTELATKAIEQLCAQEKIDTSKIQGEPEARLVQMLLDYYTRRVTQKANILKPENIRQYAEDAVQLTLIMDNIALGQLSRFRHSLQYTQKEAAALAPVIRTAVQRNGNAMVSEAVNDKGAFLSQYKAALKKLGIKIVPNETSIEQENPSEMTTESVKKDFFNMLDRINNPITY